MFSLAAGISEAFDNRWYVAIPAYSLASLDGFGRMGHDAHWFSDVVGAAILGAGQAILFAALVLLYLRLIKESLDRTMFRQAQLQGLLMAKGIMSMAEFEKLEKLEQRIETSGKIKVLPFR